MKIVMFVYSDEYQEKEYFEHRREGGAHPSDEIGEIKDFIKRFNDCSYRADNRFIRLMEMYCNKDCYKIIDLPDETTDWIIEDVEETLCYDIQAVERERLIYVVNGKLNFYEEL